MLWRAFLQLATGDRERFTGWRGRLGLLPVVSVSPALVLARLAAAPWPRCSTPPTGTLLLGVALGFHGTRVLVSVALVPVGASRVDVPRPARAGYGTGAFLAGFPQGSCCF